MVIENQQVHLPILKEKQVTLYIKREDKIHPFISGNKYRKLKYNLKYVQDNKFKTLLTFGGAFSNHIAATACAGNEYGIRTIGVIRGEELALKWENNKTLMQAYKHGMEFEFVTREQFRNKESAIFLDDLKNKFGNFYLLPEGGTNALAVKGCEEILTPSDAGFNIICAAVGTGGTLAGIINTTHKEQQVIGFPALKNGDFLSKDICKFAQKENWSLQTKYHFGGYAKINEDLVGFMNAFKKQTTIPLDPVYTAKMLYGIIDMVKKDKFVSGTKIIVIHTGGLQGIAGMNERLKKKNLQEIQ